MAAFSRLVSELRLAERELVKQLQGIRSAISSLEFGGAVSPGMPIRKRGRPARSKNRKAIIIAGGKTRKRTMSAKARAAISAAQKARWAKVKAGAKKR